MTAQEAINKVISIAKNEVGYLEKASNSNLDSFTGNAGSNNYTKYWRDIQASYQGQPWCACFVTWVLEKAFGQANTKKLLKHYPYVYCPTMASLFTLKANPKAGDIVIFYRNGEFVHTGIVTYVNGDYFETVEGNTSGGSTIVANGGSVASKSYYNSNLVGTKFCTPDYSLVANVSTHYGQEYLDKLTNKGYIQNKEIWSKFDENVPLSQLVALIDKITGGTWTSEEANANIHWVQPHVISLCGKGIITDKSQFLTNPDRAVSNAFVLALIDKATNGTLKQYVGRNTDHWGRNHLDSLCDKAIITTPSAWTNFDDSSTRAQIMALLCKAFNI